MVKHMTRVIPLLAVAAFAASCKPSEGGSTKQQIDKVKQETKEAVLDMKDYTFAQKANSPEKIKTQWAGINKDLAQLAAKVEKSRDAARAEAKPRLQKLR